MFRSYLSSLPRQINSEEKTQALTYLVEGARRCGDDADIVTTRNYVPCDVGAIIGNAYAANPKKALLKHYHVRKMVIDTQTQAQKYWLSIDSNMFIYRDATNPYKYLRYSFNGVFPATGIYCNDVYTDENWLRIRRDYNMGLKLWREHGSHILVCLQRPMGWSMRGIDLMAWLDRVYRKIRKHSDRPIRVRWHPGDWKNYPGNLDLSQFGVEVSPQGRPILEDLQDCWALVCHNSSPSSVAAIEGIPVFITDDPGYCQAGAVANTNLADIENPIMPDREEWIKRLSQCHWSFEDVRSGRCWAHMRQWVKLDPR